ncbi:MAG TPA: glycoside hydrolase family 44 protein, partial [Verrucomicrobiae bacterium]
MFALYRFQKLTALAGALAAISTTALADNPATAVNVNANGNRHAISPLIYGANWTDQATLSNLNLSVNRRGGNATSTYNWQINAANRAGDWYFESLGESDGSAPSAAPDAFITSTKAGGAQPMITIPMLDWIAKLGPNRSGLTPYSVAKYGPQTGSDPWWSDAGNGIGTNPITHTTWTIRTNNPNDAYVPNSSTIQQQWVQYLTNKFGNASGNGVRYYVMDNEYGVWPANHRPLMTNGPTMDRIRDLLLDYGGKVKAVDPASQIIAPEEWGWPNYFNSPNDTSTSSGADRAAHGGWDYIPWLLNQLKATNDATGQRLLDYFSLHYYPQYSEFDQGDSSTAAQLKRNECTRDLWDTSYVSSSWIGASVQLVPRMKAWVNTYYPGTKIAITEYNWGAEGHISGAIAQADVLGIFGREGMDLATFWGNLDSTTQIYKAFKMYRNYDGSKSTFGDTSVSATVANPDNVSAFAAQRSTNGTLTVMVLNKYLTNNTPITVNLGNFMPGNTAQVWQLTSANTINHLADAAVSSGSLSFSAPAQSITLFVIPGTNAVPTDLQALYAFEGNA